MFLLNQQSFSDLHGVLTASGSVPLGIPLNFSPFLLVSCRESSWIKGCGQAVNSVGEEGKLRGLGQLGSTVLRTFGDLVYLQQKELQGCH